VKHISHCKHPNSCIRAYTCAPILLVPVRRVDSRAHGNVDRAVYAIATSGTLPLTHPSRCNHLPHPYIHSEWAQTSGRGCCAGVRRCCALGYNCVKAACTHPTFSPSSPSSFGRSPQHTTSINTRKAPLHFIIISCFLCHADVKNIFLALNVFERLEHL